MKIQLELVDRFGRDIGQSESCDVVQVTGCVVRLQRIHLDLIGGDTQAISDTCREVIKDLLGRLPLANNERIVESMVETKLDEGRVGRSRRHATRSLNDTRQVGRDAGCSRGYTSWL